MVKGKWFLFFILVFSWRLPAETTPASAAPAPVLKTHCTQDIAALSLTPEQKVKAHIEFRTEPFRNGIPFIARYDKQGNVVYQDIAVGIERQYIPFLMEIAIEQAKQSLAQFASLYKKVYGIEIQRRSKRDSERRAQLSKELVSSQDPALKDEVKKLDIRLEYLRTNSNPTPEILEEIASLERQFEVVNEKLIALEPKAARAEFEALQYKYDEEGIPISPFFNQFKEQARATLSALGAPDQIDENGVRRKVTFDYIAEYKKILAERVAANGNANRPVSRKVPNAPNAYQMEAFVSSSVIDEKLKKVQDDFAAKSDILAEEVSKLYSQILPGPQASNEVLYRNQEVMNQAWELVNQELNEALKGFKHELWHYLPLKSLDADRLLEDVTETFGQDEDENNKNLRYKNSATQLTNSVLFAKGKINLSKFRAGYTDFTDKKNGSTHTYKVFGLQIPKAGKIVFDPVIATTVLFRNDGMFANEHGISWVLFHGDGSEKSNAASFANILEPASKVGGLFNPISITLPISGPMPTIGPEISGLEQTAAWIELVYERINELNPNQVILNLTRSASCPKAVGNAMLRAANVARNPDAKPSRAHAIVATSYSNRWTLQPQIDAMYDRKRKGLTKSIVVEALDNFSNFSAELGEEITRLKGDGSNVLQTYGDDILLIQGDLDEDGQINVIPDLEAIQRHDGELMKIYILKSPFRDKEKFPELFYQKSGNFRYTILPPELAEATHHLFLTRPNLTRAQWADMFSVERLMKIVDPEQPMTRADAEAIHARMMAVSDGDLTDYTGQLIEMWGVQLSFLDYLIDQSPLRFKAGKAKADDLRKRREEMLQGRAATFWDYYKAFLAAKKFETGGPETQPGRDVAGRLKKIEFYWQNEVARVNALISKNKLQ